MTAGMQREFAGIFEDAAAPRRTFVIEFPNSEEEHVWSFLTENAATMCPLLKEVAAAVLRSRRGQQPATEVVPDDWISRVSDAFRGRETAELVAVECRARAEERQLLQRSHQDELASVRAEVREQMAVLGEERRALAAEAQRQVAGIGGGGGGAWTEEQILLRERDAAARALEAQEVQLARSQQEVREERRATVDGAVAALREVLRTDPVGLVDKVDGLASKLLAFEEPLRAVGRAYGGDIRAKGRQAEETVFEKLCLELEPQYELTVKWQEDMEADIWIDSSDDAVRGVLLDVKNWSRAVPSREVEKMHRDMLANQRHGLLLSIHTHVVKRKNFSFEVLDGGLIAMYLSECSFDTGKKVRDALKVVECLDAWQRRCDSEGAVERGGSVLTREDVVRTCDLLNGMIAKEQERREHLEAALRGSSIATDVAKVLEMLGPGSGLLASSGAASRSSGAGRKKSRGVSRQESRRKSSGLIEEKVES
jgi:hypothetical protein